MLPDGNTTVESEKEQTRTMGVEIRPAACPFLCLLHISPPTRADARPWLDTVTKQKGRTQTERQAVDGRQCR
jgi:hypothetical protein